MVRLADDARKCVVFFGTPSPSIEDDLEPWGTGFFIETSDTGAVYLVTAAHVVSDKLYTQAADRKRLARYAMAKVAPENETKTSIPSPKHKVRAAEGKPK